MDMSKTIAPKSDQLNSDDLIGGPMTITITRVSANESAPEQPVNINFEGDNGKPYRPCKSMRRVIVHIWGKDTANYVGRSLTLYRDAEVQFGGMKVGGTRISHMSNMDKAETMALTATRANRKPFTVKPLVMQEGRKAHDKPQINLTHIEAAQAAAKRGTEAFKAWFRDNPDMRDAAKSIMPELQKTCVEIDAAIAEDPFGLPPIEANPATATDGEIEAKIRDELAARDAQLEGTE